MLTNLKKHVGTLTNTGVRIAVIFRKIPNDENYCLVVETERLPDSYHDYLIECTNSKEAAETNDLSDVLNRRSFPDGTNCLSTLHTRGWLRKEPINNVTMLPLPGRAVPLALINATIDKKLDEYNMAQKVVTEEKLAVEELTPEAIEAVAKGLVAQADILEADAAKKREEAYTMMPSLKPTKGRPALPADIKAKNMLERKAKRLARDQKNAAKNKIEKVETALTEQVNKKIVRDASRVEA